MAAMQPPPLDTQLTGCWNPSAPVFVTPTPRETFHPRRKVLKLSIPRDFHLNHDLRVCLERVSFPEQEREREIEKKESFDFPETNGEIKSCFVA